jgi:hypothetical protein
VRDREHQHEDQYDSLADMWSDYYQQYLNADFPRIIVRYEDFLFHREAVLEQIAQCITTAGASTPKQNKASPERVLQEPGKYRLSAAKEHGRSSDFITAVLKYGTNRGRYAGMDTQDMRYAVKALKPDLLRQFNYLEVPRV